MVFGTLISIIALICAVWVIYDVWANNRRASTVVKVVWTVAAILFSIVTAIIYYFVGRK